MKRNDTPLPKSPTAIKLHHVSKVYQLKHEKPTFVEQLLKRQHTESFVAINDLCLEIKKGEKVGIIGKNGAGKTTLLQLIAGITTPSSGSIVVTGKVVSLISLDAGFHPELSGYENIFLNGLIVGMRKKEIQERLGSIIAFADIGSFIDAPLYTYSSGMMLRLGFSVAVHAQPDILLLDEYIVVGDREFKRKAGKKISELSRSGTTMLLVTQEKKYINRYCQRVIEMDEGVVVREYEKNSQ